MATCSSRRPTPKWWRTCCARHYAGSLVDAIAASLGRLDGHFAFIAVHRDEPDLLAGTRRQCPLLVGIGDGETFLASSLTAFASETRRVKLVDDDEIVAITPDDVRIATADGEVIDREDVVVAGEDDIADKDGWETFMLKEINEQPAAVGKTIAANASRGPGLGVLDDLDLTGSGGWSWSPAAPPTTRHRSVATRSRSGPVSRARPRSRANGATAVR